MESNKRINITGCPKCGGAHRYIFVCSPLGSVSSCFSLSLGHIYIAANKIFANLEKNGVVESEKLPNNSRKRSINSKKEGRSKESKKTVAKTYILNCPKTNQQFEAIVSQPEDANGIFVEEDLGKVFLKHGKQGINNAVTNNFLNNRVTILKNPSRTSFHRNRLIRRSNRGVVLLGNSRISKDKKG